MQIRSPGASHGFSFGFSSRWAPAAALSCVLAGCYTPVSLPPGAPCKTSTECPTDQRCVVGLCAEAAGLTIDAGAPGSTPVGNAPGDAAPGDAGAPATCQSNDVCTTATALGQVSGDTGNQTLTAQGSRAAWFRVRVTEDGTSVDGAPLRVLARLTPPAGEDFDVRLYLNPASDTVECTKTAGTPSTSGTAKEVRASWGDNGVFDDSDDSRDVSIEIRPLSGACSPTAKWQLVIEGDPN